LGKKKIRVPVWAFLGHMMVGLSWVGVKPSLSVMTSRAHGYPLLQKYRR
jgi:hypothetical protein